MDIGDNLASVLRNTAVVSGFVLWKYLEVMRARRVDKQQPQPDEKLVSQQEDR